MARKSEPKEDSKMNGLIEQEAIKIVDNERTRWEDALVFVTDKVAFRMRELIRELRKAYWGIFDQPLDPHTGRELLWVHLSMAIVEDIRKNTDLDLKDIGFRARHPKGYALTDVTRAAVRERLTKMNLGETLDQDQGTVLIDGTVVWKTWESNEELRRRTVDLLNFYIDPTEDNIQSAYRVSERALMLPEEIMRMDGWMNNKSLDDLKASTTIARTDDMRLTSAAEPRTAKYRDVWEMWGKIPKWLITKNKEDVEEVDAQLVVSGLEAGNPLLHLVKANDKKDPEGNPLKPYEEWRPVKVAGRWYGIGPVERMLSLQEYANEVLNMRRNKNRLSQLGIFKIKKGRGITPQMISKLPANGAIVVTDVDDITQMPIEAAGPDSYKDEEVIQAWAQRVTSAFPVASGEVLPASTTATSAAISNQNAKSAYTLMKEATGHFLTRWIDRHALPIIAKKLKPKTIVRLLNDDSKFVDIIDRVIAFKVQKQMDEIYEQGLVPTPQQLAEAVESCRDRLRSSPELFFETTEEIVANMLDSELQITNENLDVGTTVNNLINMLNVAPEQRDSIIPQVYDLLGLAVPKPINPQMMGLPAGQPEQFPQENLQSTTTAGVTGNPTGQYSV